LAFSRPTAKETRQPNSIAAQAARALMMSPHLGTARRLGLWRLRHNTAFLSLAQEVPTALNNVRFEGLFAHAEFFQLSNLGEGSMQTIRFLFLSGTLVAICASSAIAAAPENLRNKTFTVSWSEEHNQSSDGGEFRDVSVPYLWTMYVSSAGRGFSRMRAGGGRRAGTHESVGKEGSSFGGGEHAATFTSSGIVVRANFGEAARQISIAVTGSGCSAQIVVGKTPGVEVAKFTRTDGRHFEIRSLHAGAASCQMQEGNAFAN